MAKDRIERSIEIDASRERVWSLLTDPVKLPEWWTYMESAELELREGAELVMVWKEHGTTRGVIEEVIPGRRFSFRWPSAPETEVGPGTSTRVTFTLEDAGQAVRVTVVESGFLELDTTEADRDTYFEENTEGWGIVLPLLRDFAES